MVKWCGVYHFVQERETMFAKDIAEGINILNKHNPGWAHRANIDELVGNKRILEIVCPKEVPPEVYRDYIEADTYCGFYIRDVVFPDPLYAKLLGEWREVIQRIQNIPEGEDFDAEAIWTI